MTAGDFRPGRQPGYAFGHGREWLSMENNLKILRQKDHLFAFISLYLNVEIDAKTLTIIGGGVQLTIPAHRP